MLQQFQETVDALNASNSQLEKKQVLKEMYEKYPEIKKLFLYTYDYQKNYYVTSSNLEKRQDLGEGNVYGDNIFALLDDLNSRKYTGHTALAKVNGFIHSNNQYKELIYCIIDRNLKTRCNETLINKVIPNCVPTFEIALAEKYDAKRVSENDTWYISRKLDGVRCLLIADPNGNISLFSREGKQFETLDVLAKEAQGLKNIVLDGEVCLMENGVENFQDVMKEIRRKDHTIVNPKYKVFDCIPYEDFRAKHSNLTLTERLELAREAVETPARNAHFELLTQEKFTEKSFSEMRQKVEKYGWEGLILRKDCPYEGKRSYSMLKVKSFFDAEYKVVGVENDVIRIIVDGKEQEVKAVSCLVIHHKGNPVGVGIGLSQEQRLAWFSDPSLIIGKVITVNYFSESLNQDGKYSLRFPSLKIIHGDKREV